MATHTPLEFGQVAAAWPWHPLQVQSPWGAITALVLLQCFGAITFNALLYHLGPGMLPNENGEKGYLILRLIVKTFLSIWGLVCIALFVTFEAMTISLIVGFFRANGVRPLLLPLHPISVVKLLLAVIFAKMLIGLHYDYPFPKPRGQRLMPLFLLVSLILSFYVVSPRQSSNSEVAGGFSAVAGVLVGLMFLAVGCAEDKLFYLAGLMGGGITTMLMCSLLLNSDRQPVEGIFLCIVAATLVYRQVKRLRKRPASKIGAAVQVE